jgi:hypothetical protein
MFLCWPVLVRQAWLWINKLSGPPFVQAPQSSVSFCQSWHACYQHYILQSVPQGNCCKANVALFQAVSLFHLVFHKNTHVFLPSLLSFFPVVLLHRVQVQHQPLGAEQYSEFAVVFSFVLLYLTHYLLPLNLV